MSKKKTNKRLHLALLYIGSFLVSIIPLLVVFVMNWGEYTKTPTDTVKLCLGGILCLVFIFLKVVGKIKMPRRIVLFGILFVMAYLLQALLNDLILLLGMALVGEVIDLICFQKAIRVTKENILIGKTADATTEKVEEVLQRYLGRT